MRGGRYNRRNRPRTAYVYTDGACSNNGQPNARAGFGVWWGPNHPNNTSKPLRGGRQTNNRAEYEAVDHALWQAEEDGYERVIIRTDSNLLIRSLTEYIFKWVNNGWRTMKGGFVQNRELLESIYARMQDLDVEFEFVNGHAGIRGNEEADRLAREGVAMNDDSNYLGYFDLYY